MLGGGKQKGVIFLKRNSFLIYAEGRQAILSLDLPETIVKNLELLNKDQLEIYLKDFFEKNRLGPLSLIIVPTDEVLFEKNLANAKVTELQAEVGKFLANVPVDEPLSKVYKQDGGYKITVLNSDFASYLKASFVDLGCTIEAFIPYFAAVKDLNSTNLSTIEIARNIIKRLDTLKPDQFVFMDEEQIPTEKPVIQTVPSAKKSETKTLPYLLATFGFLLLILGVLIVRQFMPQTSPKPPGRTTPATSP